MEEGEKVSGGVCSSSPLHTGENHIGNFATKVATDILKETICNSEGIWSIPCSAVCHSHPEHTKQGTNGLVKSGALCWTMESSCNQANHCSEYHAQCKPPHKEGGGEGEDHREPADSSNLATAPQPQINCQNLPMASGRSESATGTSCGEEGSVPVEIISKEGESPTSRTETDVVHYRLSGHSRDSLNLNGRHPLAGDWGGGRGPVGTSQAEAVSRVSAEHITNTNHLSAENLSSSSETRRKERKVSLRKGLSVNDVSSPCYSSSSCAHKSPSRVPFFKGFGFKRNRDEVTVRCTPQPQPSPPPPVNSGDQGGGGGGGGGGRGKIKSIRKTITNMFHLGGGHSTTELGAADIASSANSRRHGGNSSGGSRGGSIFRLPNKRNKSLPPGKRALPPVPPDSSSTPTTTSSSSTSTSPSLSASGGGGGGCHNDRVPPASPPGDSHDHPEGAGIAPGRDELAVPGDAGNSSLSPRKSTSTTTDDSQMDFASSIEKVKDHGWYWGPLSGEAAEKILAAEPDGSFVVRDSSDHHYIFSLTFKLNGFVRHVRIEHDQGNFSFGSFTKFKSNTIVDFIENAVEHSRSGRYLFFLHRRPVLGPMRVQLLHPVSRFKRVQSLQHLCRYVIVKHVRKDHLDELPLPNRMKSYLNTPFYYSEQVEADAQNDPSMHPLDNSDTSLEWNLPEFGDGTGGVEGELEMGGEGQVVGSGEGQVEGSGEGQVEGSGEGEVRGEGDMMGGGDTLVSGMLDLDVILPLPRASQVPGESSASSQHSLSVVRGEGELSSQNIAMLEDEGEGGGERMVVEANVIPGGLLEDVSRCQESSGTSGSSSAELADSAELEAANGKDLAAA